MSVCTSCSACCAAYRMQFAIYELDETGGTVPAALTEGSYACNKARARHGLPTTGDGLPL